MITARRSLAFVVTCTVGCATPHSQPEPDAAVDEPVSEAAGCRPPKRGDFPVDLEPALGARRFSTPVDVVRAPDDPTRAYVVEAVGTVRVVADDVDDTGAIEAPIFVDLRHHLARFTGEIGLWDVAFHPRWPETPYLYAFWSGNGGTTDFRSALSRFTSYDGGRTVDPGSEEILLSIEREANGVHGGGKLGFSADGLLWISTGDGEAYGDPAGNGQNRDVLLGKMLRLDVDGGHPYAIPADNPFAHGGGAPEIYALGFRNPWRWSFDRATGEVWLGDVGHHRREEIDVVVRGGDYGWSAREGSLCWGAPPPCDGDFIAPIHEYGRDQGGTITGGFVYRGSRLPELFGHYVYGDYTSGRIWALVDGAPRLVAETGMALSAFAEEPDGELLVMEVADGRIYRLTPTAQPRPGVPPLSLYATACYSDPARVPYEVNAALWSDGLAKERSMILPPGTLARVLPDGRWELPNETVLVKTFIHEGRPIETRLMVRLEDGDWAGWSYRWHPDGSDAVRVDGGGVANLGDRDWYFPSTAECVRCHADAADHALGIHQAQLDRGTQLAELRERGVIEHVADGVRPLAALDDASASLARRARSYLHANCSMCHQPGGSAQGDLDLRDGVPLAGTRACDEVPMFGTVGIEDDPRVIAPGRPDRSVLVARMATRGAGQMPPLATFLVDTAAVEVVSAWIASLTSCASD